MVVDTNSLPVGVRPTFDADGIATPNTISATLTNGQVLTNQNFGYTGTGSIGNYVWYDVNGDGSPQTNEPPLAGVRVFIDANGNGVWDTNEVYQITTAAGYYDFTNLVAGTYNIAVDYSTLPAGVVCTGDPDATKNGATTTILAAGQNVTTDNFGFQGNGSIAGNVLVDVNGNGIADSNDTNGIAGVTVTLQTTNGVTIATTVTSASGAYSFATLLPGSYVVVETNLSGWISTLDTAPPNDDHIPVTLVSSQVSTGNNFYDTQLAQITGSVKLDVNGNGIADSNDTNGVSPVVLKVYQGGTNLVATVTNNPDGTYSVSDLPPNIYTVVQTVPPGYTNTTPVTVNVTLTSGSTGTANYLDTQPGSIAGSVLVDVNGNGVADSNDTNGIAGVTVTLQTTNGMVLATNVTSASGAYSFPNLMPGSYVIVETNLPGWISTLDTAPPNDDHIPVTLTSGLISTNNIFYDTQPGSIAGNVLVDVNGNGIADSNDTNGIAGVTVTLQTTGGVVLASTLTSASGAYGFTNLMPGSYVVVETNLSGWISTLDTAPPNDDHIPVTLVSGQVSTGNNFYDTQLAQITGSVKLDVNGNGIADAADTNGVSPAVLKVYQGGTNLVATVTNNPDGTFSVSNLTPGSYTVVQTVPPGYTNTTPVTVNVTLTSGSTGTANYLDTQPGSIAGSVLVDVNGNGIADSNDTNGIAGVTVTLQTTNGVVLATNVTSASGAYSFTNLIPGNYVVVETNLPGWISTLDTAPPNDDHIPVTLTSGQALTSNNFYDTQPGSIAGNVLVDVNGNGVADSNDTNGIAGVTITLQTTNGVVLATNVTSASGAYSFTNLMPGNYVVVETNLPGWISTLDTAPPNDDHIPVTLTSGLVSTNNNFYDTHPGSIAGNVLVDVNGNGIADSNDTNGIVGVTVTLQTTGGVVLAATLTSASGAYSFPNLLPGSYVVVETNLSGWISTLDTAPPNDDHIPVTLVSSQVSTGNNFYDMQLAQITGSVKLDVNGNGIADSNDTNGVSPVVLKVYQGGTNLVATVTNNPDGTFSVSNLTPGSYTVVQTVPPGYTNTTPVTVSVTLTSGSTGTANYLDTLTFSIGHLVFYDKGTGVVGTTNNGVRDVGEPGISNVVMKLFAANGSGNPTGSALAMTNTDVNGYYRFDGLLAGTYVVVVDVIGSGTNLNSMVTSTGWSTNLTLAGDLYDHGKDAQMGGLSVLPGGIASVPVQVGIGLQPTNEATSGLGAGANGPGGDVSDNLVVDFGFFSPSPTAAVIAWLGAYVNANGQVWVTWQTLSELDLLYFDVWRSGLSGAATDVTPDWVDANGQASGYLYQVPDSTVLLPGTYTYSLVGWYNDLTTNVLAKATVTLATNSAGMIRIISLQPQTNGMWVRWVGGQPPYTLESQTGPGATWKPVGPAQPGDTETIVPMTNASGLYRVKGGGNE